jgi:rhodanese-related sulfurtransferase
MVTVIHNQINREMQKSKEERNIMRGSSQLKADEFQFNSLLTDERRSSGDVNIIRDSAISSEVEIGDTSDEVAVLLSGGVDSSVALKLLQLQGYKVRAFYLKIWLEDEVAHLNECPWEEDLQYAEDVCHQLGVPLETLSLQKEYWQEVVQYTFKEAREGRTPNPDMLCNSRIKFGMFYEYVGKHYSKIATGHYAQVLYGDDNVEDFSESDFAQRNKDFASSSVIEIGDDDVVDIDLDSNNSNDYTKLILDRNKDISPKEIEKLPISLNIPSLNPSQIPMKARLVTSFQSIHVYN